MKVDSKTITIVGIGVIIVAVVVFMLFRRKKSKTDDDSKTESTEQRLQRLERTMGLVVDHLEYEQEQSQQPPVQRSKEDRLRAAIPSQMDFNNVKGEKETVHAGLSQRDDPSQPIIGKKGKITTSIDDII